MALQHEEKPYGDVPTYSAVEIDSVTIDITAKRVIVRVNYGSLSGNSFKRNYSIPPRAYTLEGSDWSQFVSAPANGTKTVAGNLKTLIYNIAKAKNWESGTEV